MRVVQECRDCRPLEPSMAASLHITAQDQDPRTYRRRRSQRGFGRRANRDWSPRGELLPPAGAA
jgi:hypothetical protein